MEAYPWGWLKPKRQKTRLAGLTVAGPTSLSGTQQRARADGGGRWTTELSDIVLGTPEAIQCARAWSAYLAEGLTEVIVPIYDHAQAPWPRGFSPLTDRPTGFFGLDLAYSGGPHIVASIASAADLRATVVSLTVAPSRHSEPHRRLRESGQGFEREAGGPILAEDSGAALLGGEHFSIDHPVKGWRLYRIGRVLDVAGDVHTVEIEPPLRAAVTAGETAEFDLPRCVMTLAAGAAEAFEPTVEFTDFPTIQATFTEA